MVIAKLSEEKLVCDGEKEEEKNHTISSKFQNIWSPQPSVRGGGICKEWLEEQLSSPAFTPSLS